MKYALINDILMNIDDVKKGTKGVCPVCKDELIAKKGEIRKGYFAHRKNKSNDCELKFQHMQAKLKEKLNLDNESDKDFSDIYENIYNEDIPEFNGFTQEQLAIIVSTEKRVMVNAKAGSGKSSVAEEYIRRNTNKEILYVVFNRSMRIEGEQRFGDLENVEIRTIHSLAYGEFGSKYKLNLINNLNIFDVAKAIKLFMKEPKDFYFVDKLLEHFTNYLTSYCKSIDEYCDKYKCSEFKVAMKKLFKKSKDGGCKVTHNFYFKLWHLSNPDLSYYDTVICDEFQDVSQAMVDILLQNNKVDRIIVIGDIAQSIYAFAGAVNGFELLNESWKQYDLSYSFRIGETIAKIIRNSFSYLYNTDFNIKGMNKNQLVIEEINEKEPYFMLCRYNATIIRETIEKAIEGNKIYIEGGKAGVGFEFIKNIYKFVFYNEKHFTLKKFESVSHMVKFADDTNNYEIKLAMQLIEEYGESLMFKIRSAEENLVKDWKSADICLTTTHKCKGKSITIPMKLANDFENLKKGFVSGKLDTEEMIQEINLYYVANTRCKNKIEFPKLLKNIYEKTLDKSLPKMLK